MTQAQTTPVNRAKSHGPATTEARSQNARKDNLTATGSILLPHESQEEYDRQLAAFMADHKPVGLVEIGLVNEIASTRWRLSRMMEMETAIFSAAIQEQLEAIGTDANMDGATARAYAHVAESSKGFRLLIRYEKDLRRKYEKALQELAKIQQERLSRNEPEPEPDYSSLKAVAASQTTRPEDFVQAAKSCLQLQQAAPAAPPLLKRAA